jgi:DNA mismatch repair ATPase MutS
MATIIEKYRELKAKHPDAIVLLKLGDRYLTYDEDAKLLHREIGSYLDYKDLMQDFAGFKAFRSAGLLATLAVKKHEVHVEEINNQNNNQQTNYGKI